VTPVNAICTRKDSVKEWRAAFAALYIGNMGKGMRAALDETFDFARDVLQTLTQVELLHALNPGVVDESVERWKLLNHLIVQRTYCSGIADVAFESVDGGKCPFRIFKLFLTSAGYDDNIPALKKLFGQLKAHAAASPGNENRPVLKLH
jgi:hypothetical protein